MANVNERLRKAVEDRRKELRLEPREMAEKAGLTPQGLRNVRRGHERKYHESTIFGVARALQWEPDWYDRILAGKHPTPSTGSASSAPPDLVAELREAIEQAAQRDELLGDLISAAERIDVVLRSMSDRLVRNAEILERIDAHVHALASVPPPDPGPPRRR